MILHVLILSVIESYKVIEGYSFPRAEYYCITDRQNGLFELLVQVINNFFSLFLALFYHLPQIIITCTTSYIPPCLAPTEMENQPLKYNPYTNKCNIIP